MKSIRFVLSLLGATALAAAAQAHVVKLDTSSLIGAGTFYVDFQLNDGNGVGDGNNSAYITNINLGGGSIAGPASAWGGVWGDLGTGIALSDTEAFNEFFQAFLPGTFLSFELSLTNNFNGPVPDMFGFAILDESLFNLPTYAPGSDQLLTVELNGGERVWQTYGTASGIASPSVPDAASTALLFVAGMFGMAGLHRVTRRAASA